MLKGALTNAFMRSVLGILFSAAFILATFTILFSALMHRFVSISDQQRRDNLVQIVSLARNAIEPILEEVRSGGAPPEEGRDRVRNLIRKMTYHDQNGPNYVFMSNYEGVMLVQPFEPQKELTNQYQLQDDHGNFLIQMLIAKARSPEGGGFVEYYYMPPRSATSQLKMSYVIGIPELQCYVGTGMYMQRPYIEQQQVLRLARGLSIGLILLFLVPILLSVRQMHIHNRALAMQIHNREAAEAALREQEETFRALAENSPDIIARFDRELRHTYINPSVKRLTGYPPERIIGKKHTELPLKSELAKLLRDSVQHVFETAQLQRLEFQFANGIWIESLGIPEMGPDGKVHAVISAARDITDRKRAELELRQSEERYRTMFELSCDPVCIVRNEVFIDCNLAAIRVYKAASREQLIGQSPLILSPPRQSDGRDSREAGSRYIQRTLAGESQYFEWEHTALDGSFLWLEVALSRIEIAGEGVVLASMRDITDRKRAEAALIESETRFRNLFEMAPIPLAYVFSDGRIERLNQRFTQILGYTLQDVPALAHWWPLAYPDPVYRDYVIRVWDNAVRIAQSTQEDVPPLEYSVTGRDGNVHTLLIGARVMGRDLLISLIDISERKRIEEKMLERDRQLQAQNESLQDLITTGRMFMGDFQGAIEQVTEVSGRLLKVGRVSIWLYSDDYVDLQCIDLFEFAKHAHSAGETLRATDFPTYVNSHLHGHVVVADDVYTNPATCEIPESYYHEHDIYSLLDIPIWMGQRIRGILSFEATGSKRAWTPEDERLASMMGAVISLAFEIAERKQAEEALRVSENKLRSLFSAMPDVIIVFNQEGRYLEIAPTKTSLLYRPPEQLLGKTIHDVFPPEKANMLLGVVRAALSSGKPVNIDYELDIEDRTIWFSASVIPLADNQAMVVARDITDRKEAEAEREALHAQLLQAQKMEAVGQLAGGVAHDFNNMLQTILGYVDLAEEELETTAPIRPYIDEIRKAAERSANLTRQLLAYARRQTIAPVIIDLNAAIQNTLVMLRRLIGEDINLVWKPSIDLHTVRMDPVQVDQILANLCVNARDAIKGVGAITIETQNAHFDDGYCLTHNGFAPGDFALLSISDTGCGMDKALLGKVFEPFFTTKEVGEGTGLGLATVYGIVKQNDGFINVYSEPGVGTIFKIYFPRCTGKTSEPAHAEPESIPLGHGERILVVEDEPSILNMAVEMLAGLGYAALSAGTPASAIVLANELDGPLDLLLTDIIMPEMNGRDLAKRLMAIRPGIKCLYMSGYTADVITRQEVLLQDIHFLQKPFTKRTLAIHVREVLDQQA